MTIEELFNLFQSHVEQEKVFLYERYENDQLFIAFRNSYGKHLDESESTYLTEILRDEEWKWFVPHVVRVMEKFPNSLLEALMHTAINEKDPSYNGIFIDPCIRVYDVFSVNKIVLGYLKNGTYEEKIGALKAIYWTRPHIVSVGNDTFGYRFEWLDSENCYDWRNMNTQEYFRMDKIEEEAYFEKIGLLKNQRMEVLLNEFLGTSDGRIRYQISLYLPKDIKKFPKELSEDARLYVKEVKNVKMPTS